MSLDRRIYLATFVSAVALGSAVVLAAPAEPLADIATLHTAGMTAEPAMPAATERAIEPPGEAGQRLVLLSGQGGIGVKPPAVWPVDLQREMQAVPPQTVGMLR